MKRCERHRSRTAEHELYAGQGHGLLNCHDSVSGQPRHDYNGASQACAHYCLSLAWFNTLPAAHISVTGSSPAAGCLCPLLLPAGVFRPPVPWPLQAAGHAKSSPLAPRSPPAPHHRPPADRGHQAHFTADSSGPRKRCQILRCPHVQLRAGTMRHSSQRPKPRALPVTPPHRTCRKMLARGMLHSNQKSAPPQCRQCAGSVWVSAPQPFW